MGVRITKVEAKPDYRLFVEFADGASGTLDLSDRLFGPVFEPLRDPLVFRQVAVDEFGALAWPNGADLAPDAIHQEVARSIASSSAVASR